MPSDMPKIFLSYARIDANIVHEIYAFLKTISGIDVWYDKQDIVPSKNWQQQIEEGLDECDVLLLIASYYSISSKAVWDEIRYFKDKQQKLIYIVLIDNSLPEHEVLYSEIADYPTFDFRLDPLDKNFWWKMITEIRDNKKIYRYQEVLEAVYPSYVQKFLSQIRRLNLSFAAIGFLLLFMAQFPPQDSRIEANFILGTLWLIDVMLSVWLQRFISLRRLKESFLGFAGLQVPLRVILLVKFLSDLSLAVLSYFDFLPLSLLDPVIFVFALGIAFYLVREIYERILDNDFEHYRYANADIPRRFINTLGLNNDDSATPIYATLGRLFSMDSIFNSKLVGWLPVYAISWNFRAKHPDDEEVKAKKLAGKNRKKVVLKAFCLDALRPPYVYILYDPRDLPIARYMAQGMGGYNLQAQLSSSIDAIEELESQNFVPIVTAYSVQAVDTFCEEHPDNKCLPVLIQKVRLNDYPTLRKLQYIDAHVDYSSAFEKIQSSLNGDLLNTVSGEIEDRRKFFIPKSSMILFIPSMTIIIGSAVLVSLFLLEILFPTLLIPDPIEDPVTLFLSLAVILIPTNILPLLIIIYGARRKYSLSTIAIANIVMALPFILFFLNTFSFSAIGQLLPLIPLAGMVLIPSIMSAILAWTDSNVNRLFGDSPVSPKVWAPDNGLSWGIVVYMTLLVIAGVFFASFAR